MSTELTPAEARVLDAYRVMDRQAKGETLMFVERQARNYPEPPPPRRLRIIQGGAS
jgi:hypothetical protein